MPNVLPDDFAEAGASAFFSSLAACSFDSDLDLGASFALDLDSGAGAVFDLVPFVSLASDSVSVLVFFAADFGSPVVSLYMHYQHGVYA